MGELSRLPKLIPMLQMVFDARDNAIRSRDSSPVGSPHAGRRHGSPHHGGARRYAHTAATGDWLECTHGLLSSLSVRLLELSLVELALLVELVCTAAAAAAAAMIMGYMFLYCKDISISLNNTHDDLHACKNEAQRGP